MSFEGLSQIGQISIPVQDLHLLEMESHVASDKFPWCAPPLLDNITNH